MANTFSTEAALTQLLPRQYPNASIAGGRVRRYRNTITLTSQAIADTITCLPLPPNQPFAYGVMTTDTSLSTSTIAIGKTGSASYYKAAAVLTATNTPTLFGNAAAAAEDFATNAVTPIITVAALALPASGTLIVDFYCGGI